MTVVDKILRKKQEATPEVIAKQQQQLQQQIEVMQRSSGGILGSMVSENISIPEKVIQEISSHLFDVSIIYMISDLTPEQINYVYKLVIIDECFCKTYITDEKLQPVMSNLIQKLLMLTISKNRQSREEVIRMFAGAKEQADELRRKSLLGR